MPTYEYTCKNCGEHLEVVQSFKEDSLTECPACGGSLRKVFGSIGIAFRGSGFYRTDSRAGSSSAKSEAAAAKSESKAAEATSSSESATAGSKSSSDSSASGGNDKAKTDTSKAAGSGSKAEPKSA